MTDKAAFRRRLLGGGLLSLVMAVGLAVALEPTTPTAWLPVAWIGIGGLALLTAAGLERLPLGVVTIGWPRVAAVGLGILALGSSTFGFVQLLTEASSLSLIYAGFALVAALALAIVTLECLLGGVGLDEETFAVE
ncbi:hypothetical protein [Natronolimnobius baerhuensis]|uniref:Uncharacterized protein n=1 Tax=Natronolimnobius baerhuensis TaxID=253108 RepID=A0A202EBG9_9EURY|nr:hypothetical protein [Natronolimnobius baerhuensis]OVE85310.1 hypothetical protein B2G88_00315 [Natronolimnobius baerhuensis]